MTLLTTSIQNLSAALYFRYKSTAAACVFVPPTATIVTTSSAAGDGGGHGWPTSQGSREAGTAARQLDLLQNYLCALDLHMETAYGRNHVAS